MLFLRYENALGGDVVHERGQGEQVSALRITSLRASSDKRGKKVSSIDWSRDNVEYRKFHQGSCREL